jgi:hypothetical protein
VTLKIVGCLSMSTIGKRCVTIPEVCMHVHMSDNRETMSEAENSWLPVDVDNKEILCDDKRGLRAFSRER